VGFSEKFGRSGCVDFDASKPSSTPLLEMSFRSWQLKTRFRIRFGRRVFLRFGGTGNGLPQAHCVSLGGEQWLAIGEIPGQAPLFSSFFGDLKMTLFFE
jgi:hypothetical protein